MFNGIIYNQGQVYKINVTKIGTSIFVHSKNLIRKKLLDQQKLKKNFKVCKLKELKTEFKKMYAKDTS